jgi:hypothetical protein
MVDDQEFRQRKVARRLLWLRESGATLPPDLAKNLESWEDEQREREAAIKAPPTLEERIGTIQCASEVAELIAGEGEDQLSPWEVTFSVGDLLTGWLAKHPDQATELFQALLARGQRGEDLASRIVTWLSDHDRHLDLQRSLSLLTEAGGAQRSAYLVSSVTWALKVIAEKKVEFDEEPGFWRLWSTAARMAADSAGPAQPHEGDPLTDSLNAPGGYLAQSLIFRLHLEEEKNIIQREELRERLEMLSIGDRDFHFLARVMLASRLPWLHHMDREWAKDALIARMGWAASEPTSEARGLWQGYLWAPSLNPQLLEDLKSAFLQALTCDLEFRGDHNLFHLFADLLLKAPEKLSTDEKQRVFRNMPVDGLAACAHYWRRVLQGTPESAADIWKEKIDPLIKSYWPVTNAKVTPDTVEALARLVIRTNDAFPEALNTISERGLLSRCARSGFVVSEIAGKQSDSESVNYYDHLHKHPRETLDLIDQSINFDILTYERSRLKDILERAREADVSVEQTDVYGRLYQRAQS